MDSGIHLIDLAIWLFDAPVTAVSCEMTSMPGWQVESEAEVWLDFVGGGRAHLACSYTHGVDSTVRIRGEDGWARTSVHPSTELEFFGRRTMICRRDGAQQVLVPEGDPYQLTLAHFSECLLSGRPFIVRSDQVIAGLQVVERCYAAAAGGTQP